MSEAAYLALVDEFSKAFTEEEAAVFKATGDFTLQGVNFTLLHIPQIVPELVHVICDIGKLGKADELACYKRMLEMNYMFVHQFAPQMAIDPETGMQVFINRMPLEYLTAELLMNGVISLIPFAKQWREGDFPVPPMDE